LDISDAEILGIIFNHFTQCRTA